MEEVIVECLKYCRTYHPAVLHIQSASTWTRLHFPSVFFCILVSFSRLFILVLTFTVQASTRINNMLELANVVVTGVSSAKGSSIDDVFYTLNIDIYVGTVSRICMKWHTFYVSRITMWKSLLILSSLPQPPGGLYFCDVARAVQKSMLMKTSNRVICFENHMKKKIMCTKSPEQTVTRLRHIARAL